MATRTKNRPQRRKGTTVITHTTDIGVLAAAVALRALGRDCAGLRFASIRTLARTIEEEAAGGAKRLLILGHRPFDRRVQIREALEKASKKRIEITWLGSPEFPDPTWETFRPPANLAVPRAAKDLVHAACLHFELGQDPVAANLVKASTGNPKSDTEPAFARDLAAGMVDRYWQFDDEEASPAAVKALSEGGPYTPEMHRAVAVYRRYGLTHLTGKSEAIREVRRHISRMKDHPSARVVLYGESGTGKEVAARLIHLGSPRAEQPFLAVNCATLRGDLLLSHLFGHEKGAFTGAHEARAGLFETAHGGTLFMDEVAELDLIAQAYLLRVLQEHKVRRLGSFKDHEVDVRVVAATNRDLAQRVKEKAFREDLYYRLATLELTIPPLRTRPEDVPYIADELLYDLWRETNPGGKGKRPTLSRKAREDLKAYSWPGNVRELQSILTRALVYDSLGDITSVIDRRRVLSASPPAPAASDQPPPADLFTTGPAPLQQVVDDYLAWLLEKLPSKAEVQRVARIGQGRLYRSLKRGRSE